MIVLGVDPGFSFTGYSIFSQQKGITTLVECGLIRLKPTEVLSERVKIFYERCFIFVEKFNIEQISLETSFLYKNPQTFLKLGFLRGILYLIAAQKKIIIKEFSPSQIKFAITGSGSASKEQVARVLLRLFPRIKSFEKEDVSDAVAIGLCGLWQKG
jgi:crossover junction endodeoxyribonuclease RuvC